MTVRTNLFIGAWLAVQLLLPIRGFVYDKYDTRGNFSWNMYSQHYRCDLEYRQVDLHGERPIYFGDVFQDVKAVSHVYDRKRLPHLNEFLCNELRDYDEEFVGLRGSARCVLNNDDGQNLFVDGDLCTSPNFGVRP